MTATLAPKKTMTKQLSIRLTNQQKDFIEEQVRLLRTHDASRTFCWSEADVIRGMLNDSMSRKFNALVGFENWKQ